MPKQAPKPYQPKRGIIVVCKDEADQAATYDKLKSLGFTDLRVVTA